MKGDKPRICTFKQFIYAPQKVHVSMVASPYKESNKFRNLKTSPEELTTSNNLNARGQVRINIKKPDNISQE